MSEEKFMEPTRHWLDNLKVRGSWGSLGNQEVDTYAYISEYSSVDYVAWNMGGTRPMGMLTNIELNHYLCSLYGFGPTFLSDKSNEYFARHTDVFKDYTCEIVPAKEGELAPTLVVKNKKNKKKQLTINAFTNIVKAGKKADETVRLNSVVVYVDKNNTFYLPASLAEFME